MLEDSQEVQLLTVLIIQKIRHLNYSFILFNAQMCRRYPFANIIEQIRRKYKFKTPTSISRNNVSLCVFFSLIQASLGNLLSPVEL